MPNDETEEESRQPISPEAERFLHDLRMFMMDYEVFNQLRDEKEVSRRMLLLATSMTVNTFNATPPLSGTYTLKQMLQSHLLEPTLYHAASNVLMMRAQQQERNQLTYSDGGRSEVINDKAPSYKNTYQMLRQYSLELFKKFKVAQNLNSGYGHSKGVHSDYAYIDDYL